MTSIGLTARPGAASPTSTVRAVPSFKHRRGRITAGQAEALSSVWPRLGLELASTPIDPAVVFGRVAPLILEIGFGMGETTLAMAAADPGRDVLAVDVHTPGAGSLLRELDARGIENVRVLVADAYDVLADMVGPQSLDEIRLYFPDPWPKVKHHKRRLFNPAFAALAAARLRPGGRVHAATDWAPYAEQMLRVVDAEPLLVNPYGGAAPRPPHRPVTRFEGQGLAKGHRITDVLAYRSPVPAP